MSNYISILKTAFNNNLLHEAVDAKQSLETCARSREALTEVDIAKITSFTLKLVGTISLIDLGFTLVGIVRKRSISPFRFCFTVASFFLTFDLLKGANNLRFEYTMSFDEKKGLVDQKNKGLFGQTWDAGKHVINRATQAIASGVEYIVINNTEELTDIRASRVAIAAIKNTSVFEPVCRAFGLVK